ncbi:MAG: OsmC family protein [Alphaproteobacteria bacterium]|nr:OsmC family protein [Alphaproteobacteria bacterium]
MRISAHVQSSRDAHRVTLSTADNARPFAVAAKPSGAGSSVNGGEFLMLALATCYCNDVYREAARQGIPVDGVDVEAQADFEGVGLAARNITYRARIASPAPAAAIEALLRQTDAVAEVQNTLRAGVGVTMRPWEARDT